MSPDHTQLPGFNKAPERVPPQGHVAALGETVLRPNDLEIVSQTVNTFMRELYGHERYAAHNEAIRQCYDEFSEVSVGKQDPIKRNIDLLTIQIHDFVEHTVLDPYKTARKLGLPSSEADTIKARAIDTFNKLLEMVSDKSGLTMAYLYAIDASKSETAAAQTWRPGANEKVLELLRKGEIEPRAAIVINAVVNRKEELQQLDQSEVADVVTDRKNFLLDLPLKAINEGARKHNVEGNFFKAVETYVNIKNPPQNNPASTYRDCTEALNYMVPSLVLHGYKKLANALRGAALEWMYGDPDSKASTQNKLSAQYAGEITAYATEILRENFAGADEAEIESRVKTVGSISAKLNLPKYANADMVPDGVGLAFILPDSTDYEQMQRFAKAYQGTLTVGPTHVEIRNPHSDIPEELFEEVDRANGYRAIHMTFYYYPESSDLPVPFEIQVMTKSMQQRKIYDRFSDLFYKAGSTAKDEDLPILREEQKRAAASRNLPPGSATQSIAEMVNASPEVHSAFNEIFRSINSPGGARILVPIEFEESARVIFDAHPEALGENGDLTILPPSVVTKEQFFEALNIFGRGLSDDRNILNALKLVENEQNELRRDGRTSVLEGHILPVTIAAVMMAIESGISFQSDLEPAKQLSVIATVALLHDYVEDKLKGLPVTEIPNARNDLLLDLKNTFGEVIAKSVAALSSPQEITDEFKRREAYAAQIRGDYYAKLCKNPDRLQNHVSDLIRIVTDAPQLTEEGLLKIKKYFEKSDRHLGDDLVSKELPPIYARTKEIVWLIKNNLLRP